MDLATLKTEEGAKIELLHPVTGEVLVDDNGAPITITVCGQDSKQYSEAANAIARKRMARKNKDYSAASMEADGIELLARCTINWSGIKENGQYLEFNEENCKRIYRDYKWIREQVDTAIMDRSLFLKR